MENSETLQPQDVEEVGQERIHTRDLIQELRTFSKLQNVKAGQSTRQTLNGKPAYLVPAKGRIEVRGSDGTVVTANARDGVAVVDQDEIEIVALEDAEIVLVETDRLN